MLGFVPADTGGGVMMHVVNTGLFPLDAEGTRLVSGEDAVLHITEQNAKGHYTLTPAPALDLWQRLTLLVFCLLPLAASLLVRPEPGPGEAAAAAAIDPRPRRRRLLIGGIVLAVVVSVAAVNQTVAYGSYAAKITNSASSAGTRTFFNCRNALTSLDSSTWFAYAAGTNARNEPDLVTTDPDHPGQYTTAPTLYTGSELGCTRDSPQAAAVFNGARCLYVRTNNTATTGANANIFTLEAWFSTSTKKNGKIVGFGTATSSPYTSGTTVEDHYDRHVYLDKDGRVVFGVYPGNVQIVYTQAGKNYADGKWHHVVATLSPAGQRLFVDGALAMENAAVTTAENFSGYWKVGCGNLSSWRHAATDEAGTGANDYNDGPLYFTGNLQYVAVYTVALTATQAKEHYLAGAP